MCLPRRLASRWAVSFARRAGVAIVVVLWMLGASASAGAGARLATAARARTPAPIGLHAMLFSNTPVAFERTMFQEAAALGVPYIRLDVDLTELFASPDGAPDFSSLDALMALSEEYHVKVLADVLATPWWLASCPASRLGATDSWDCFTDAPARYAQLIGAVAAHTKGVIDDFEFINEPDLMHYGTPQQYAAMLAASAPAIHRADPRARVLLGGLAGGNPDWARQMLTALAADGARHSYDVANVHLRYPLSQLPGKVAFWRALFAGYGFTGPLWVTEHGYPSDPAFQYDRAYRGTDAGSGLAAQAAYLNASIPTLVRAGAAMVFVTERDAMGGQFASEGILSGQVFDPTLDLPSYRVVEKPSFATVRALVTRWEHDGTLSPPVANPRAHASSSGRRRHARPRRRRHRRHTAARHRHR